MTTAGLILAGGASTRMGRPKLTLVLDGGETFVARLVRLLCEAGCDPVVVVLGSAAESLRDAVPEQARVVVAADWAKGMRASLRAGVGALPPVPILLTHVDRPWVQPETLAALLAAPPGAAVPTYRGHRGHPVLLPPVLRSALLDQNDNRPLHDLLADAHEVPVGDRGVLHDVDTPLDYEALLGQCGACGLPHEP